MRPFALLVSAILAANLAAPRADAAEAPVSPAPTEQEHAHGILSHGDSGDIMEDFFGGRVERKPPEEAVPGRKHDPAIRWDDRPLKR